ncbi:MAG TPA: hypothetical protein VN494_08035 [Patescibacteria group bacterium]|nr:hypothetical protein [Patescibacteria group bacterium]
MVRWTLVFTGHAGRDAKSQMLVTPAPLVCVGRLQLNHDAITLAIVHRFSADHDEP